MIDVAKNLSNGVIMRKEYYHTQLYCVIVHQLA
jgi:hypothetical protein